jgi:hypothetical protein
MEFCPIVDSDFCRDIVSESSRRRAAKVLQIGACVGPRLAGATAREFRSVRSAAADKSRIWQVSGSHPVPGASDDDDERCAIPHRIARNGLRGMAALVIWKLTSRARRTIFAPILISFAANFVSDQRCTPRGRSKGRKKMARWCTRADSCTRNGFA